MENISMSQALDVWSELWQAYYGHNGFGSNVAEIYAFRLQPSSPSASSEIDVGMQAAKSLYALLCMFKDRYECDIEINGEELGDWFTYTPFMDRCQVAITHRERHGKIT